MKQSIYQEKKKKLKDKKERKWGTEREFSRARRSRCKGYSDCFANTENRDVELEEEEAPLANTLENEGVVVVEDFAPKDVIA